MINDSGQVRSLLIDTGIPLTAYDSGDGEIAAEIGSLSLFSMDEPAVPRLRLTKIQLFSTPLRSVGLDPGFKVEAVLGGDQLARFAVSFDYRVDKTTSARSSQISFLTSLNACSCDLADSCEAVLPFTIQGGQQTIALKRGLYLYPPSRVLLDGCIEPLADPISRDLACTDTNAVVQAAYRTSGVDIKFLVATGFPGLALSTSAYARLRGTVAATAIEAQAPIMLHLPDAANDGNESKGLPVRLASLGSADRDALALVSKEFFYGPCAELARSRRQRRFPPQAQLPDSDPRSRDSACVFSRSRTPLDPQVRACATQTGGASGCDDDANNTPIAAVLEFAGTIPIYVIDNLSPLFLSINADLNPTVAVVEGVIGTELLQRLSSTIDYPSGRFVAHCSQTDVNSRECLTYRRYIKSNQCARDCTPPSALANDASGGLCPATSNTF